MPTPDKDQTTPPATPQADAPQADTPNPQATPPKDEPAKDEPAKAAPDSESPTAQVESLTAQVETLTATVQSLTEALTAAKAETAAAKAETEAAVAQAVAEAIAEKDRIIRDLLVKGAFASSAFLRDCTVLPPDFAYAYFGARFSVEEKDGAPIVVARNEKSEPLYSAANPAAFADVDEALRMLVEEHSDRDSLLRAPSPDGGGGTLPGSVSSGAAPRLPATLSDCRTREEKISWLQRHTR